MPRSLCESFRISTLAPPFPSSVLLLNNRCIKPQGCSERTQRMRKTRSNEARALRPLGLGNVSRGRARSRGGPEGSLRGESNLRRMLRARVLAAATARRGERGRGGGGRSLRCATERAGGVSTQEIRESGGGWALPSSGGTYISDRPAVALLVRRRPVSALRVSRSDS